MANCPFHTDEKCIQDLGPVKRCGGDHGKCPRLGAPMARPEQVEAEIEALNTAEGTITLCCPECSTLTEWDKTVFPNQSELPRLTLTWVMRGQLDQRQPPHRPSLWFR